MYYNQANYFFVLYEQEEVPNEEPQSTIGKIIESHSSLQGDYKRKSYDLSQWSDALKDVYMQLRTHSNDLNYDCGWFAKTLTNSTDNDFDSDSHLLYKGSKNLPDAFDYDKIPIGSLIHMSVDFDSLDRAPLEAEKRELFFEHEKIVIDAYFKDLLHYFLIYKGNGGDCSFDQKNLVSIYGSLVQGMDLIEKDKQDASVKTMYKKEKRFIWNTLQRLQGIDIDFFSDFYENDCDFDSIWNNIENSDRYKSFLQGKIDGLYQSKIENEKLQKAYEYPDCLLVPTHYMVYIGKGLVISKLGKGPICISSLQEVVNFYADLGTGEKGGNHRLNGIQLHYKE